MIRSFFNNDDFNWLKLLGVILVWIIAAAYVIHHYGSSWENALVDSLVHTFLIIGGFMLLENIFNFYLPQRAFGWLGLDFTLIFVVVIAYVGDFILNYIFANQTEHLLFLEQAFLAKSFILLVLFGSYTILIIFNTKLEDQLKLLQRKEETEKMAKDAELYQLRQQLQPHFLFNSLNSISALISRDPGQAREMVLQLSDFLRGTIRKDDKKWILVEEEIVHLQLFLNIERVRFGHRLKVDFHIGEGSGFLKIPQLLVQPLLENAVKHGLYGVMGEVTIVLDIMKAGDYLEITISNPFDPAGGQAEGTGFGLDAVKRRLYLLFGRHDLLRVSSLENTYTVWIKIPQLYDQDNYH